MAVGITSSTAASTIPLHDHEQQHMAPLHDSPSKGPVVHATGYASYHIDPLDPTPVLIKQDKAHAEAADPHLLSPSPSASPSPPRSASPSFETSAKLDETSDFTYSRKTTNSFENVSRHPQGLLGSGEFVIESPRPISKTHPTHELPDIPEEKIKHLWKLSAPRATTDDKVLKLSPSELEELTSALESLPLPVQPLLHSSEPAVRQGILRADKSVSERNVSGSRKVNNASEKPRTPSVDRVDRGLTSHRPGFGMRALSTPVTTRHHSASNSGVEQSSPNPRPAHHLSGQGSNFDLAAGKSPSSQAKIRPNSETEADPMQRVIPLPPMSIPTYLQLELASTRPSPLYIHPVVSEYPYESSRIKFERLLNFLILPPQLEQVLLFGALACLDAWLSTFTILPLRFMKAAGILLQWWSQVLVREARFISGFVYHGVGRMWHRRRGPSSSVDTNIPWSRSESRSNRPSLSTTSSFQTPKNSETTAPNGSVVERRLDQDRISKPTWGRKHKRTKSRPSTLSSYNKADLLQGLVIIFSSAILMSFDASRMYHSIRGQSAMKLYVLYNVLEVVDRLFAALGQDIFECLTSDETLDRGADGRSKVLQPFGMFLLALIYNVVHAAALFYQVVTLNVAVNSYSNALLSLLMSNQFVEIKGTVFKKFEKENLFQLTCADVVERFQLWLMLVIIGMRNVVEVGGLSLASSPLTGEDIVRNATVPLRNRSILPNSFTILPVWTGEVLSPFLVVLGSEMLVDWVKHAYISKFNSVKPAVYQKFLDVLAKDYYTNAFVNQNLIKRLGLPVIPLSCLFIRASVQTYYMFLAVHMPTPIPSVATALSVESATSSPTAASLEHFDNIIRKALGRSSFGAGIDGPSKSWWMFDTDDMIAFVAMLTFFLGAYLVLLACKLVLGMLLLRFARNRYQTMKDREHLSLDTKGKRLGGWGTVEVDDEKKRAIYEDDPEGMRALIQREKKAAEKAAQADAKGVDFGKVARYEMAAKRIW